MSVFTVECWISVFMIWSCGKISINIHWNARIAFPQLNQTLPKMSTHIIVVNVIYLYSVIQLSLNTILFVPFISPSIGIAIES